MLYNTPKINIYCIQAINIFFGESVPDDNDFQHHLLTALPHSAADRRSLTGLSVSAVHFQFVSGLLSDRFGFR